MATHPFLTADVPPIQGRLRASAEDFVVDELPAYLPVGTGEHLLIRFEKTGLDTVEAVRRIARALEVDPDAAGFAGLKDRHAITTQWASFHRGDPARAATLELEGIRVLESGLHGNKLRTGHLRGNRFDLRLRDVPADRHDALRAVLERLAREGVPNYYGEQRFGRGGRNVADARAWLVEGGRPPRDRHKKKLLVSVLQSEAFNDVLAARLTDGLFARALPGDLLRKEDSGGLFVTSDLEDAQRRLDAFEISATGPMFGADMRWPEGEVLERERAALARAGLDEAKLDAFRAAGSGTRRALRVRLSELVLTPEEDALRVTFSLPPGAYATVVMREVFKNGAVADTPSP